MKVSKKTQKKKAVTKRKIKKNETEGKEKS
ncbi:hypothetical protein MED92_10014 [Oceanospirillum sp. MED92]|uniref:Uncharacterized protein n=1 Tax=Neptuniibacter caesariensis TaxID=207954 RepID=A0A7U8GT87_NEPCE|nr:hypothetical protein MED92_10014 [Oceanospirillum sp. MED92] [Neptuniibacter caesariensis]